MAANSRSSALMGRICVRCEATRPRTSKIALLDQPDFGDLAAAAVAAQARLPLPGQRQLAARSRFRGNIEFDRLDRPGLGPEGMDFQAVARPHADLFVRTVAGVPQ